MIEENDKELKNKKSKKVQVRNLINSVILFNGKRIEPKSIFNIDKNEAKELFERKYIEVVKVSEV